MAVKKYQIFISSTFADLQEERRLATKAILDLDHIPAGMEAFPAVDIEQFEYIKKVIDECDYYVLIVGARYGSVDSAGVSYTEREFDYAVSNKKPVIALIHNDIENLPRKKFDTDPALFDKLTAFRDKVKNGRMVRMWNNADQLTAGLLTGIQKTIQVAPSHGWVRGDTIATNEVLQQYMKLREAYDGLQTELEELRALNSPKLEDLADLTDVFELRYRYSTERSHGLNASFNTTWGTILKIVGPQLISPTSSSMIDHRLTSHLRQIDRGKTSVVINSADTDTVKLHLHALGLLQVYSAEAVKGGVTEFVSLSDRGRAELVRITAIRRGTIPDASAG